VGGRAPFPAQARRRAVHPLDGGAGYARQGRSIKRVRAAHVGQRGCPCISFIFSNTQNGKVAAYGSTKTTASREFLSELAGVNRVLVLDTGLLLRKPGRASCINQTGCAIV